MKIYTKTGDRGETSLFSGERLPKSDLRIEAYGTLDELNSHLGVVAASISPEMKKLHTELESIQTQLFRIGSSLATTPDSSPRNHLKELNPASIERLETAIDEMTGWLPPLDSFILPGGNPAAAAAHVARTVCRRTERAVVRLGHSIPEPVDPQIELGQKYLNRLADYLFVLARYLNRINDLNDKKLK